MTLKTGKVIAIGIIIIITLLSSFLFSLPISSDLDFFPVYAQVKGLFRGIPLYNETYLYQSLRSDFPTLISSEVPPLAQPPWYFYLLSFLNLLNLDSATKCWFAINLLMLIATTMIWTYKSSPRCKIASILATFCYYPVIGHLVVGQFTIPVLLGISLLKHAIAINSRTFAILGFTLCTLKPHIGLFPACAAISFLFFSNQKEKRISSILCLISLAALLAISTAVDPNWINTYPEALARVANRSQNIICDTCISLTYSASTSFGFSNSEKWQFSTYLLSFLVGTITLASASLAKKSILTQSTVLAIACLLGLIFNPYVRNYDAVMAMPAFLLLFSQTSSKLFQITGLLIYFISEVLTYNSERGDPVGYYWIPFLALLLVLGLHLFADRLATDNKHEKTDYIK